MIYDVIRTIYDVIYRHCVIFRYHLLFTQNNGSLFLTKPGLGHRRTCAPVKSGKNLRIMTPWTPWDHTHGVIFARMQTYDWRLIAYFLGLLSYPVSGVRP